MSETATPSEREQLKEWHYYEGYRKGFEDGGRLERERADWLEAERERLEAKIASLRGVSAQ